MTIWNLGSINADHVYSVAQFARPGETIAATGFETGLGGKGANMSVSIARAGAHVAHIGAVGADGVRWLDRLTEYGVDTRHVARGDVPTGHAIIMVDASGENAITIYPGANRAIADTAIRDALRGAAAGDTLLFQNETNGQETAIAAGGHLRVAYAAAPFDADAALALLPRIDLLFVNAVEARELEQATGQGIAELPPADIVVTRGADGADWHDTRTGETRHYDAVVVDAVDTTGAGDTFTGYVLAALDRGQPMGQAIGQAIRAAALMVTRHGAADVIPDLAEVRDFGAH